jgi:hypothetical protein
VTGVGNGTWSCTVAHHITSPTSSVHYQRYRTVLYSTVSPSDIQCAQYNQPGLKTRAEAGLPVFPDFSSHSNQGTPSFVLGCGIYVDGSSGGGGGSSGGA